MCFQNCKHYPAIAVLDVIYQIVKDSIKVDVSHENVSQDTNVVHHVMISAQNVKLVLVNVVLIVIFNSFCPDTKKECIALTLNALNLMNCPLYKVYTMKYNQGCPFSPNCPHKNEPKCAYSEKNKNQNNNNNSNNSSNNNISRNNSQNNSIGPYGHIPNNKNFPNILKDTLILVNNINK